MTKGIKTRRWMAACGLGLLVACGCTEPRAPVQSENAGPATSSSATPAVAAPTAAPPAIPTVPEAPVSPEPASASTIGDVTCERDADCAITTRAECCDCCASAPRATSGAWLDWRDHTMCAQTTCEPCGKVKCPSVEPPSTFRVACERGQCALVRKQK
jgi:hypothetical protein